MTQSDKICTGLYRCASYALLMSKTKDCEASLSFKASVDLGIGPAPPVGMDMDIKLSKADAGTQWNVGKYKEGYHQYAPLLSFHDLPKRPFLLFRRPTTSSPTGQVKPSRSSSPTNTGLRIHTSRRIQVATPYKRRSVRIKEAEKEITIHTNIKGNVGHLRMNSEKNEAEIDVIDTLEDEEEEWDDNSVAPSLMSDIPSSPVGSLHDSLPATPVTPHRLGKRTRQPDSSPDEYRRRPIKKIKKDST